MFEYQPVQYRSYNLDTLIAYKASCNNKLNFAYNKD